MSKKPAAPLETVREYAILTAATLLLVAGIYLFKFPNNFSFGGVTGAAIVLARLLPFSAGSITFVVNIALLLLGFAFLGRGFGFKTVYVSVLMSVALGACERWLPIDAPLTGEPLLELIFAVILPSLSSAILFDREASSGGTDIVAMILKKYTSLNIGAALFVVDLAIVLLSFFVFGVQTGLFSVLGLLSKSLVIDDVIESINLCKFFTIICDDPAPVCRFIQTELRRSATVFPARGAYSQEPKSVVLAVMRRRQAVRLRNFIRQTQPNAFIMITNSSEIIGKGFRGFN